MKPTVNEDTAMNKAVHEAQGWFPDNESLQAAIAKLELAHYDRTAFRLPEEQVVANPAASPLNDSLEAPETPIDHQQVRTLGTGMASYAGAAIAAGIVVATGGAAALVAGAAAAGGLGAAAISAGVGKAAYQAHVDEHDRDGAAGTLVLAVQVTGQVQADEVARIMRENGATQTELTNRVDEVPTGGVSASAWTGTA